MSARKDFRSVAKIPQRDHVPRGKERRRSKRWWRFPMRNTATLQVATPAAREIVLTRIYETPHQRDGSR
jgi:hypothetical protein